MKKTLLTAGMLVMAMTAFGAEQVLWETGMTGVGDTNGHVPGDYQTGLIVSPEAFSDLGAGTQLNISISSSAWAQVYIKNYDKEQIYPTIDLNVGENISVVLTNFQLEQISKGGLRIDASTSLDITKVAVETGVYSGDFKNAIWIGDNTFTSDWGGRPVEIIPLEVQQFKVGDTLKVYYSKTADDAYMMATFTNGNFPNDYQPDWQWFGDGDGQQFVIDKTFVDTLDGKAFTLKGYSIRITQVDLVPQGIADNVNVIYENENAAVGNVYSISGVLLHRNVNTSEIVGQLPAGLYIVGGKKIIVR